ncbi:hypothetical protein GW932_03355 [archaeon]|nr:hypothetical protein [archaeon]
MTNNYIGKQTQIIFDNEAYQLSIFNEGKIKYSENKYEEVKEETKTKQRLPSLFEKYSDLELKFN